MGSRHTRVARCTGRRSRAWRGWCRPCAAWRRRMAHGGVLRRSSNAWQYRDRAGAADYHLKQHQHHGGVMQRAVTVAVMTATMALTSAVYADTPANDSHAPPQVPTTVADWARGARLFQGLGDFHRAVTSSSAPAQQYFDQGMRLLWAFNHDESTRSFAKAAELDPACAACYWGVALTVGPNYNVPAMEEPRARVAWEALHQAQENAAHASAVEQALISALAARYPAPHPPAPADSDAILIAYAAAMRSVAEHFPDDLDVQTLCAEGEMNVHAWKLWTADGQPVAETLENELPRGATFVA